MRNKLSKYSWTLLFLVMLLYGLMSMRGTTVYASAPPETPEPMHFSSNEIIDVDNMLPYHKWYSGTDFVLTPATSNYVSMKNDESSYYGLYAYDSNSSNGTEIMISAPGYSFDLSSFKFYRGDDITKPPINLSITITYLDDTTNNGTYQLGGAMGVHDFSGFDSDKIPNDVKSIKLVTDNYITYNDFVITDIQPISLNTKPAFVGTTTTLVVDKSTAATDIACLLQVNDADSGQTLTWSVNSAPTQGTLSFGGTTASTGSGALTPGTINYTPKAGCASSDSFTIAVSDGTDTVTRTINVSISGVPWTGGTAATFVGGSGTAGDPFQIATAEQLAYMEKLINATATHSTYRDKYYKLVANIDLAGKQWIPIVGAGDSSMYFNGNFNGNNYTISNFAIGTAASPNTTYGNVGLFGRVYGGSINNLGIENVLIYSSKTGASLGGMVGALDGYAGITSTVTNCYATGHISGGNGYGFAGGLVGMFAYSNISNCYTAGSVTGGADASAGGFIGGVQTKGSVTSCYSTSSVSVLGGTDPAAGGFIGYLGTVDTAYGATLTITNCYATGNVDCSIAAYTGGFAGYRQGCTLSGCYYNSSATQSANGVQLTAKGVAYSNGSYSGDATAKTSDEMKSTAFVTLLSTGWSLDTNIKNQGYPTLSIFKVISSDLYKISYNGNGNTSGAAPIDTGAYPSSTNAVLAANMGALTKTGYIFGGWNTSADGTGTHYSACASYSVVGNVTLYAEWYSSDATLKSSATVKGQTVASLGTPNAVIASIVPGSVTITAAMASDITNGLGYVTLFEKNNSKALVKAVKYSTGAPTTGFAEDTAYTNQAITNGDFFLIRVTAQDGTTINYYRIDVSVTSSPAVTTEVATGIASKGATLNGTVNANNASSTVTFEYGTTASYGTTVTASQSPVSGSTATSVSYGLTGLSANTTYHYRVVATSSGGTSYGLDRTFTTTSDSTSTITAGAGVTEPVSILTTVNSLGTAVDVFDFTVNDPGTSDGLPTVINQITLAATGTGDFNKVTWRLNGPDVSNATGTYNSSAHTITFSGLSISVADGGNETYTVNAYYNDNTGLTENQTYLLSLNGSSTTSVTVSNAGSQMATGQSAVTNGTGSAVEVTATRLLFATQPANSISGVSMTQPVVHAVDAAGNLDTGYAGSITLTEASAGSLSGTAAVNASAGVAIYSGLKYTATVDQESFTLTVSTTGLGSVASNALNSDVVATKLVFQTQPVPTSILSGSAADFTTVPVVRAVDANGTVDTGYGTAIALAVTDPADATVDGTINGLTCTGDSDASTTTVTITPTGGVATFTGLRLTYTAEGSSDTIALKVSSGTLTVAVSNNITAIAVPVVTGVTLPASAFYKLGANIDFKLKFSDTVLVTENAGDKPYLTLSLDNGGSVRAYYQSGSSSDTLTFRYIVAAGNEDLNGISLSSPIALNGGTIKNSFGTDAVLNFTVPDTIGIKVDGIVPAKPVVTGITQDLGVSGTDGITNDQTLSIQGTADPGSTVTVMLNGTVRGTATVLVSGDWSFDYTGTTLSQGTYLITATAADAAGNISTPSEEYTIMIDTTKPASPVIASITEDSGASSNDGITKDTTLMISGTAESNSFVEVTDTITSSTIGTIKADASGNWSLDRSATPLSEGSYSLVATAQDNAGNKSTNSSSFTLKIDATAPTVTLTSSTASLTNVKPIPVTITFSESVTGLTLGDITVGNGTATNLAGSGKDYTVEITPTGDGTVTVSIEAGVVRDGAGNDNTAATQLVRTSDRTIPTVTLTSSTESLTKVSPIPVTITFSENVTGLVLADITVVNGTAANLAGSGKDYTIEITPTADGTVTVDIGAGKVQDGAGNGNTAATQLVRTSDRTAPTSGSITINGNAAYATGSSATLTLSTSGASQMMISENSSFSGAGYVLYTTSTSFTLSSGDGTKTVYVKFKDDAGNETSVVSDSILLDTTIPTVTLSSSTASLTNVKPIPVTITFSESVTGLTLADITVTNGTAANLAGSGKNYSVEITPTADGSVTVDIGAGVAQDDAGNGNTTATQLSRTSDRTAPTGGSITINGNAAYATGTSVTLTLSATGASEMMISENSNFSGAVEEAYATSKAFTLSSSNGTKTVYVKFKDAAGNESTAASDSIVLDTMVPTVAVSGSVISPTNAATISVTITFSEVVTGFDITDIIVGNGTVGSFFGSGALYTAVITPSHDGTVTVNIGDGAAKDNAGNSNTAAVQFSRTSDRTAPTVTITSTYTGSTSAENIPVTITFSENVSDFDVTDLVVGNGIAGSFTGSGKYYSTLITPSQDGTVTVGIKIGAAQDAAGNVSAPAQLAIISDRTAPVVSGSSISNITNTAVSFGTTINEPGTIYFIIVPTGSAAPTAAQVKAGTAYGGVILTSHGSQAIDTSSYTYTFSITGLFPGTGYDIYIIAEDDETTPNMVGTVTKLEADTPYIQLTAFDSIVNVDAGYAKSATYSNNAAVIEALPKNVTANGGTVTIPVNSWIETDTYNPSAAGSYTFTAVLGALPAGYQNTTGLTATVEVVIINRTYHVTYDINGGTGTAPTDTKAYIEEESVILAGTSGFSKLHYSFSGWAVSATGSAISGPYPMKAVDTTFYAQWTENPKYTVTYDINGGSGITPVDLGQYYAGDTVSVVTSGGAITRANHSFGGWSTVPGSGSVGGSYTMGDGNVVFYAVWVEDGKYTVAYDANGGSGTVPVDFGQYYQGEDINIKSGIALSKTHYSFTGWSLAPGAAVVIGQAITMGNQNVVLYAVWTENPKYSISYDSNGGTGTAPVNPEQYYEGDIVTLPGSNGLTKQGYSFDGWSISASGSKIDTAGYTMGNSNAHLYAVWKTILVTPTEPTTPTQPTTPTEPTTPTQPTTPTEPTTPTQPSTPAITTTPSPALTPTPTPKPATQEVRQVNVNGVSNTTGNTANNTANNDTATKSVAKVNIVREITEEKKVDTVVLDQKKTEEVLEKLVEQKKDTVQIVVDDIPEDKTDEVAVTINKTSVQKLSDNKVTLEVKTEQVSIQVPADTLKTISAKDEDLYFRVIPIKDEVQKTEAIQNAITAEVVQSEAGSNGVTALGMPMTIETNYKSLSTKVTFSLKDVTIPEDEEQRRVFLNSLGVYINHSDGTQELNRGTIKYDEEGNPTGIEIEINKFSTFTIVSIGNTKPTASALKLKGKKTAGSKLTLSYTYSDGEKDKQGHSKIVWYRADSKSGKNKKVITKDTLSYQLTKKDQGKYILVSVTPVAKTGSKDGDTVSLVIKVAAATKATTVPEVKPEKATYTSHVKLGLIGSKGYTESVVGLFEKNYQPVKVVMKSEGKYYRIFLDFTDKAAAKAACENMKQKRYIVNYYYYEK